ncbi:3-hydroxyacyl-CoA dehydrogenase, partial [Trypanosoma conorhini]
KAAPAAPVPPKAAPAAPEPPKAAPAAPVPPKAAPAAPAPPKAATAAPVPPKAAPAAPAPRKAVPAGTFSSSNSYFTSGGLGVEPTRTRGDGRRSGDRGYHREASGGEPTRRMGRPTTSITGDKRLSLNDIVEDVGQIKLVFAQRGTAGSVASAPAPHTVAPPVPPTPPPPPPPPPQAAATSLPASTPSAGDASGRRPAVPVGASLEVEDEIFFTIAPRRSEESPREDAWAKSVGFAVDEEIENARATRPLLRSAKAAQETSAKLRLGVVPDKEEPVVDATVAKQNLKPLPEKEAAGIERHEIPDGVSERASVAQMTGMKDASEEGEQTEPSASTTASEGKEEGSSPVSPKGTVTSARDNATTTTTPVEQPPLAPWTSITEPEDGENTPWAKVSFESDGSPVATILLESQPPHLMSLVKFLHQTITAIDDQHTAAGTTTEVRLTTFPTLGFFNASHGPLESASEERMELLRAKQRLFARMESASNRIRFVAVVHGGAIEDFGAELFLACSHRELLGTTQATFGFPSIQLGDFPAAATVRRLGYFYGAQRTLEMAPKFHEYSVESVMEVGLLRGSSPLPAPSFLLRLERAMLALLSRPTQKELLLRKLFFTGGFETSTAMVGPNPLLRAWGRYAMAALVQGHGAGSGDAAATLARETKSERIFSEMVCTTPAINAANVYTLGREMKRRVLPLLPSQRFVTFRGEEMRYWDEKMEAVSSSKDDCAAVLLDCSQRSFAATAQMVHVRQDLLRGVNVVLIGEEHVARPIVATLPCSVVVSCASPYRVSALGTLQEVRLFSQESCPAEASAAALNAALTYLQAQGNPYVVCRGSCSKRLIAALATEACRLTQRCDVACIERAATEVLGLLVGPFHLIDYFGPAAVRRMLDDTKDMNAQGNPLLVDCLPAIAHHALQAMSTDGYLGVNSRRGGFFLYRADGTTIAPNAEVPRLYFSRPLSDTEVADRLLAVVVNECCELILSGAVRSATDANALTVAAIGFRETTGGALALADRAGISALVQKMEELANWHGPHLRPSSLLRCMAHSKVSFAALSDAMVQSARM